MKIRLKALNTLTRQYGYFWRRDVLAASRVADDMVILPTTVYNDIARQHGLGLGDVIHSLVGPVARLSDKYLGTKLEQCEGCKRRREKLNEIRLRK